jgi:hypothetical protein
MKLTRALALAAALAVGAADDCVAQTYPTRPVRVVVPFGPAIIVSGVGWLRGAAEPRRGPKAAPRVWVAAAPESGPPPA